MLRRISAPALHRLRHMASPQDLQAFRDAAAGPERFRTRLLDLSHSDLDRVDISGGSFLGCNFTGSRIHEASVFTQCAFGGSVFVGADVRGTLFQNCNLSHTSFQDSDLRGATFLECIANEASFRGARMRAIDMKRCAFRNCDFALADLARSTLERSDFSLSSFVRARLGGSRLYASSVTGADFTEALGLDKLEIWGRLGIDFDSVEQSGELPRSLFQGAGLPDDVIDFYLARAGAILYYSCFISCSDEDREMTEKLHSFLQTRGIRNWIYFESMKIGDQLRGTIDSAIRVHDKLLLVLSGSSVGSSWVRDEVESAFERERQTGANIVFPIRIDDAVMDSDQAWAANIRRTRHIGDFRAWRDAHSWDAACERLIRDLSQVRPEPAIGTAARSTEVDQESHHGSKAHVGAQARFIRDGGRSRLVVANTGQEPLHNVDVAVPEEATSFLLLRNSLPVARLPVGQSFDLPVALVMGGGPRIFEVMVTALAEDGSSHGFPSIVSL